MAKDYFQDILSQPKAPERAAGVQRSENSTASVEDDDKTVNYASPVRGPSVQASGERTIRNISVSSRRPIRTTSSDIRDKSSGVTPPFNPTRPEVKNPSRRWMWVAAILALIVLILLGLFAFRNTKITVTPTSRQIILDEKMRFMAYPSSTTTAGVLSYNVVVNDLEDSAVIPSKAMEHVSERSSGNITVYNDFSNTPVRIVKNTRFTTPEGLIFRVPASISIPGKGENKPGKVTVTVIADAPGTEYNIAPVARFTLPGLKSTPAMYSNVYAVSTSAMTGGFLGDRAAVAPSVLEAARAEVRGRLESKAHDNLRSLTTDSTIAFPDLARISFETLPNTLEAGGGVRIHEKARVAVPVFPASIFASTAYHMIDQNADSASVRIDGSEALVAHQLSTTSGGVIVSDPIYFTVSGTTTLVWNVDSSALASALAGKNQSDFQEVVKGFPAIHEAKATIEPFWKSSFPTDSGKIRIVLSPPQKGQ